MFLERIARWLTERHRQDLGARGEREAARHLRRQGYRILGMNWRCAAGEGDIIARARDGALVFVEVKSRESDEVDPEEQVHGFKQRQVGRVADVYCRRFGANLPLIRFDIVAVLWPVGGKPMVRHHADAFVPPD